MKHPEITTNDIPSVLLRNLKAFNKKPVLLLATYGLGKSQTPNKKTRKMEFDSHPTKPNCLHFEELLLASAPVVLSVFQIGVALCQHTQKTRDIVNSIKL